MHILPFNKNELFIDSYIHNVIQIVLSLKAKHNYSADIEFVANMINAKTYLGDKQSKSIIIDKTSMTEKEIIILLNRSIKESLENNFDAIYLKNPLWIEKALWKECLHPIIFEITYAKKNYRNLSKKKTLAFERFYLKRDLFMTLVLSLKTTCGRMFQN